MNFSPQNSKVLNTSPEISIISFIGIVVLFSKIIFWLYKSIFLTIPVTVIYAPPFFIKSGMKYVKITSDFLCNCFVSICIFASNVLFNSSPISILESTILAVSVTKSSYPS